MLNQVDRQQYPELSLGEILLLRNWVKPETLEFFLNLETELSPAFRELSLEQRLQKAAVISPADLQRAHKDQAQLNCSVDKILVLNGVLNQETTNYFRQLG